MFIMNRGASFVDGISGKTNNRIIQKLYETNDAKEFSMLLSKLPDKVRTFIDSIPRAEQFPLFHPRCLMGKKTQQSAEVRCNFVLYPSKLSK